MNNTFSRFAIKLIIVLAIVFSIHLLVLKLLELPLYDNKIVLSYAVNASLAIAIFGFLYLMKKRFKDQLGFLFLAGSVLKFIVFFIVFYPIYKQDGVVSKLEFASFFIPYAISLILETISLSKWLNKMN